MGKQRGYLASVFVLFLLVLIVPINTVSISSGSSDGMKGAMDPTIWVETQQDSYSFCVEPGHVDEGVIIGTLYCEFQTGTPRGTKVTVDLLIIGGSLSYKASVIHTFIKGSAEEPIDFRIDLPELTALPADLEYFLTLYPNWYNAAANRQGMGEEKTIDVDILPYGSVLVNPPNPQNFNVGDDHRIEISIKNMGNMVSTFKVKVDAGDLEVSLPLTEIRIENGRVGDYPIFVKQSSGIGKEGDIKVSVTSGIPGDHNSETIFIRYKTQTTVGEFMLRPVPLTLSFLLITILITGSVLLVRRFKRSRSDS